MKGGVVGERRDEGGGGAKRGLVQENVNEASSTTDKLTVTTECSVAARKKNIYVRSSN